MKKRIQGLTFIMLELHHPIKPHETASETLPSRRFSDKRERETESDLFIIKDWSVLFRDVAQPSMEWRCKLPSGDQE
jgi:hypothetical protein